MLAVRFFVGPDINQVSTDSNYLVLAWNLADLWKNTVTLAKSHCQDNVYVDPERLHATSL